MHGTMRIKSLFLFLQGICFGLGLMGMNLSLSAADQERIQVKVEGYDPYGGQAGFINLVCYRLMQEDPNLEVVPFTQMQIQGGPGSEAGKYMAFAGQTAPDVITWVEFHNVRSYTRQNFFLPLNEFIGEDLDGDGYISDDEAIWEEWKHIPEYYRRVATLDGKIYGIPNLTMGMAAIIYRKDLLRKAGVDPETPPKDWDELYQILQRLTHPQLEVPGARIRRGQMGIALEPQGWQFCAWVWAGGGEIVVQGKTHPRTGQTHWYAQEELSFLDPQTGEDLSDLPSQWKAAFGEQGGQRALGFYRKMRFSPWIRDPRTQDPVNLSQSDLQAGRVVLPDGEEIAFSREEVIQGVSRVNWGADQFSVMELLRRGEVAMIFFVCEATHFKMMDIPPENLGFWAVPPFQSDQKPAMLAHFHYRALNSSLGGKDNAEKRLKAWNILSTLNGSRGAEWEVQHQVKAGLARFLDPMMLKRYGMEEYLDDIPEHWRKNWQEALSWSRTEPFEGFWPPIKTKILNNDVLSLSLTREDFDYRTALIKAQHDANAGLMFERPEQEMIRYRRWGWTVFALWLMGLILLLLKVKRALSIKAKQGDVLGRSGPGGIAWAPILLLAPAILLIALWNYYPLLRGSVMAFQDYKVLAGARWVGVDNFINVFLDKNFWIYLRKTIKFAFLSMGLGFFTPVFLALLLSEVPRAKIFFRTLFFLPQVSSGLVILLLWKLFYDPTVGGFLNRLFWFAEPIDWLGSPRLAMIAVILPGIWAGSGMGSLIYLAALKSIPHDLYEAAEVDGTTVWQKIRHITLPSLAPLLIINFIGSFIGTFHAMGNIFAMTAGGPGNETMVLSLAIWYEAFAYLRFGTATAMAWFLGTLLIGFTLQQLRILQRVEFRRAAVD